MATITVGGLATGLDTDTIIQKLLAVQQVPITAMQTRKLKYQAQSAAFTDLNGKLLTLKKVADNLRDPAKFFARSVSSSDDTVATAAAATGDLTGTFSLTASSLARGSIAAAATTKSALTDTVAAGDGSFTFKLGASGTPRTIAVTSATTLEQLVKQINDAGAGVKASAVNVGTSTVPAYQLTLTSTGTGTANDIVIVNDPTTLGVASTQAATDAEFDITGLGHFKRSTNTISDAIDGITINLKAASGSTDLAISYDKGTTQSKVQGFLDAYNAIVQAIDAQTDAKVDSGGTVTPGAFTGDSVTRVLRGSLSSTIASMVTGTFGRLADVGITTQSDGTLALDSTKFTKALDADPSGVATLFAGTSSQSGIMDLLYAKADDATKAVTGTIAVRRDGLTATMQSIQKDIDRATTQLSTYEDTLRAKFNALEHLVSQTQSSGTALLAALGALTKSNNGG